MIEGAKCYIFLDNFCLKQPLVLNIPLGMFLTQETQKWHRNCPKTYWYWAIGKSYQNLTCSIYLWYKMSHHSWVNFFLIALLWTWFGEKMSSSSFLVHSQSSIEVRQFFRTNFIKLLLSDYTVYGIFVWENFCHFW